VDGDLENALDKLDGHGANFVRRCHDGARVPASSPPRPDQSQANNLSHDPIPTSKELLGYKAGTKQGEAHTMR
jgi:hypothetical protein